MPLKYNTEKSSNIRLSTSNSDSEYDLEWDDFVKNHPNGTLFHLSSWLKILARESGQNILKLCSTNEQNDINGIFPLQFTSGLPFGIGGIPGTRRLSSLPRTPTGGPLTANDFVTKSIIEKAIDSVEKDNGRLLQIKSFSSDLDDKVTLLNKYFWREIFIKEIEDSPDQLRFGNSRNHATVKRAVNKAKKCGVSFRFADSMRDLIQWYSLYLETMRYHTTPARSFDFYKNIWEELRPMGLMKLAVAEITQGGIKKIIAGNILFYYNKIVNYAFNGSNRKYFKLHANDLLHWEAIYDAQKKGFKYYDFGEVSQAHSGLAAYKKKWSSTIWKMNHYYYPKLLATANKKLDPGTIKGLRGHIWQRIPLKITEKIGKQVFKKL